ncbi:MAG TPA: mycothiol synthase [Mycobacteriales bacterium]|nr:mycothiol synthase [Mycobacteriales bacterium]
MTIHIIVRTELDAAQARTVLGLLDAATGTDGVAPVSEHVLLNLRHGGRAHHLLATEASPGTGAPELAGYAHLDTADPEHGPGAELAVHPAHRRHGVATALLGELELISDRTDAAGRLRVWAHGEHPGATALARRRGYLAERVLWQMRRSLRPDLPALEVPAGIRIRPFRVGQDERAWTEVNNRAFAAHPDQGGWDVDQVRIRQREPWFDPAGFLLAERTGDNGAAGTVVGFHWTKVHPAGPGDGDEPVGEVYVVGVDPAAQGTGLGRVLTLAGLHHMRAAGLAEVMLYVDGSNAPAVAVYTRLGFTRSRTDVQYARPRG